MGVSGQVRQHRLGAERSEDMEYRQDLGGGDMLEKGVGLFRFPGGFSLPFLYSSSACFRLKWDKHEPSTLRLILDPKPQTLPGSNTTRPKHGPGPGAQNQQVLSSQSS